MLSLRLKSGEYLTIGEEIAVQIFRQTGDSFEVAVKAPREIPVLRGDVFERTAKRPEGLRDHRRKSPSELNANARRLTALARQEALRIRQAEDIQTIITLLHKVENDPANSLSELAKARELLERLGEELG